MGPGRAFQSRCVSDPNTTYEFAGLVGLGSPRYLQLEPARTRRAHVEELVNEGDFHPREQLDVTSVETYSVDVRDGDFSRPWI